MPRTKTRAAEPTARTANLGEARLDVKAALAIRTAIKFAGGNEVCFAGTLDADGTIVAARVVARGDVGSVLALPGFAERGQMLLHNHPSGRLMPSDADMDIAARMHGNGIGFGIVDNDATKVYVVTEVPLESIAKPISPDGVDDDLGPDGLIAATMRLSNGQPFEDRPSQRAMARAVADAYNTSSVALLEAGTGVGKSLGYLVPALRWAAANKERTVVSTNTITLQEQLVNKDLPFLQLALDDQPVRFALLKGWRNYLCKQRLEQARTSGATLLESSQLAELEVIASWAERTKDGSLSDLATPPRSEIWDEVAAEPDLCGRLKCQFYDGCFLFAARKAAAVADVVVVNHHLLLSDVAVRRTTQNWEDSAVLPSYKRLIIDEGHHLEEAAGSHLGSSVTRRGLARLFARLERRGKGLLPALAAKLGGATDLHSVASLDLVKERLMPSNTAARELAAHVFDSLSSVLELENVQMMRLSEDFTQHVVWKGTIEKSLDALLKEISLLQEALTTVRERLESDLKRSEEMAPLINEVRAVGRRLQAAGDSLAQALRPPASGPAVVRWIEMTGKPGPDRNLAAHCVPLELAPVLRDDLFARVQTTIITSATLATDRGFDFLEQRLGLDQSTKSKHSAVFPSPFDYAQQALMVVPTDLPAPNVDPAEHLHRVIMQLRDLTKLSDGGVFALFTSHRDVREAARVLREEALGFDARWPLLVHGEDSRDALLRRFRESSRAVLLGTSSFWEGVDVPGDALRALLIAKLPFRVPTEPMVAAQCEAIEAAGRNAFGEFMLPHAALRLKQGFGRLIRTATDRGVIVICDPRVVTKQYGMQLLAGLPPARRLKGAWARLVPEIQRFYDRG
ncbi:MAG: helicase C-terminal domain-containing protein [Gemmatimonas sp.]